MRFTKMHGLGNDYIYLNGLEGLPERLPELARRMSDRHFGVGSDGVIWVCPSDRAHFKMRMFNADGSEGEMCGNGIRCLGKYVYDKGLTGETRLTIETGGGLRTLELLTEEGRVRDLIRAVQAARKKAGLQVDDRIRLSLGVKVPEQWRGVLMNEVLATELGQEGNYEYDEIAKGGGENVTISLEKVG